MNKENLPLPQARKDKLITKEVADELIVYDRLSDRALCLNPTAAFVWTRCDGKTSVARLTELLEAETKTPVEQEIVLYALEELSKSKLLDDSYAAIAPKQTMSRRAVMRWGVAAAVTIPFISSITAPTAAQAGTCLPSGSLCASGESCCSNSCVDSGRGDFECV